MALTKQILPSLPQILPFLFPERDPEDFTEEVNDNQFRTQMLSKVKELWNTFKKGAWRDQACIIPVISGIQSPFAVEEYNNYYLDELQEVAKNGNRETKKLSLKAICELLIENYITDKRTHVLKNLIEMAKAKDFYTRFQFLVFCEIAIDYFSFQMLNELGIFKLYLDLAEDKISNIRLKFVKITLNIWKICDKGVRNSISAKLNIIYKADKNREVRYLAEKQLVNIRDFPEELLDKQCEGEEIKVRREAGLKVKEENEKKKIEIAKQNEEELKKQIQSIGKKKSSTEMTYKKTLDTGKKNILKKGPSSGGSSLIETKKKKKPDTTRPVTSIETKGAAHKSLIDPKKSNC